MLHMFATEISIFKLLCFLIYHLWIPSVWKPVESSKLFVVVKATGFVIKRCSIEGFNFEKRRILLQNFLITLTIYKICNHSKFSYLSNSLEHEMTRGNSRCGRIPNFQLSPSSIILKFPRNFPWPRKFESFEVCGKVPCFWGIQATRCTCCLSSRHRKLEMFWCLVLAWNRRVSEISN